MKAAYLAIAASALLSSAFDVYAQQMNLDGYTVVGNTLKSGQTLNQGEMIQSGPNPALAAVAVLQRDGNFCVYRLDPANAKKGNFVKCSMTVGAPEKQTAKLVMQTDGNLAAYNSKGQHLWSTDTYRGGVDRMGGELFVYADGALILMSKSGDKAVWKFDGGRQY